MRRGVMPPCDRACPDRRPGCQTPENCRKWAEYSALKLAEKERQIAAGNMHRDYNAARSGARKRRWYRHV